MRWVRIGAAVGVGALLLGAGMAAVLQTGDRGRTARAVVVEQPLGGPPTAPAPVAPSPVAPATTAPTPVAVVPPPASLAGLVVALDPGHNRDNGTSPQTRREVDSGNGPKACNTTGTATDDGYPESRFTMELATRLRTVLEDRGATVRMTREAEAGWGPCIDDRGRFGAESGADLLLSLHADGSTEPGDRGFHVIRPAPLAGWTDDIAAPSAELAVTVRDALVAAGFEQSTYRGADGIDARTDLGTLNWSDVPVVLVEAFNMRDAREAALFRSPEGQQRLATALATAVERFASGD